MVHLMVLGHTIECPLHTYNWGDFLAEIQTETCQCLLVGESEPDRQRPFQSAGMMGQRRLNRKVNVMGGGIRTTEETTDTDLCICSLQLCIWLNINVESIDCNVDILSEQ